MNTSNSTTDTPLKRCIQCKNEYPRTKAYFPPDKKYKDGLRGHCRECDRRRSQKWAKENPDRSKASKAKWRESNREKKKTYDLKYRQIHAGRLREKARKRRRDYPDQKKEEWQRRRARLKLLPSTFTSRDWQVALKFFNNTCAYCENGVSLFDHHKTLHRDHFVPLSKGGGYTPYNIVPACQSCNYAKRDQDPYEWIRARFSKQKANRVLKRIQGYFAQFSTLG